MARTGTGTVTESGEGAEEGAGAAAGAIEGGVCSEVGEVGDGEVEAGDDFWHSRKHLEHMFIVEAEPKKPQPFAQGGGEEVPCSESPCPLSAIWKVLVGDSGR